MSQERDNFFSFNFVFFSIFPCQESLIFAKLFYFCKGLWCRVEMLSEINGNKLETVNMERIHSEPTEHKFVLQIVFYFQRFISVMLIIICFSGS